MAINPSLVGSGVGLLRRANHLCKLGGALALWAGLMLLPAQAAAPKVASVSPATGATGVSLTSPLVFVFDQQMDVDVAIIPTVPPFLIGNLELGPSGKVSPMDCVWEEDERTLTCTPVEDLPANTTVTWKLNPAGSIFPITSKDGTELATTTGSYTTGAGGGGGGPTGPTLVSANPAPGATAVPVTATVIFVFDQAMQKNPALGGFPPLVPGAIAWTGTGVTASKFSYAWSEDGKTLTCDYTGDLPGTTTISWALNPSGTAILLQNEEGEPLASDTYSGSFTTTAGQGGGGDCDPDGLSDDWGSYALTKMGSYSQTSAADPVPLPEDPFSFYVGVMGPQAGPAVTGGFVAPPVGGNRTLQGFGTAYFFSESTPTEAAIDAAYPAGNYVLHFTQSGQPERVITMNMPAANVPAPKLINFADAQAVNAHLDFTLQWNPFTGAGANDHQSLVISDIQSGVVFEAPDACVPRELPVTATSIVLPAGTLQMDKTYHASLTFTRSFYFATNAVPSMAGFGALSKTTEFTVKTGTGGGGGGTAARFTGYRLLPNGDTEMDLTGTPLTNYTLQRTSNLLLPAWQPVGIVVMDAAGRTTFRDSDGGKVMPLFYRAVTN